MTESERAQRNTGETGVRIVVAADPAEDESARQKATALATFTGLPLVDADDPAVELRIIATGDRVELRWTEPGLKKRQPVKPVYVDLLKLDITSGHGRSKKTPLARAIGVAKGDVQPHVLDATAGLGEDTWLLAALGCRVTAVERHPVLAQLLADGLARAAVEHPAVAERIDLYHSQSQHMLRAVTSDENNQLLRLFGVGSAQPWEGIDVVYLDPMFPPGRGSALESRPMRLLRRLAGADLDADELFRPALQAAGRRVVVKRPRHAEPLAGEKPDVVHGGKAVRFDVYLPRVR